MATKINKIKQLRGSCPRKRSVTGCLTCRRRKKKCDERKPICNACTRNFLECTWPAVLSKNTEEMKDQNSPGDNKTVPKYAIEFQISLCKDAKFLKYTAGPIWTFENFTVNLNSGKISQYSTTSNKFVEISEFSLDDENGGRVLDQESINNSSPEDHFTQSNRWLDNELEHLDLQLELFPIINIPSVEAIEISEDDNSRYKVLGDARAPQTMEFETLFQKCKKREPVPDSEFRGIDMEKFLFYTCLQGYIPKMNTQYTHSSLTTQATFIPQVEKNVIMKEVFLCCGATYLAWNNVQRFQNMSDELYVNCKLMIRNYIRQNENTAQEDWLFTALQLLCNRDKNSLTGTADDAAWHLIRAYDIIRTRYCGSRTKLSEFTIIDKLVNSNLTLQPQERTLIESFIYQYSVSLFFVQDTKGLPSPFTIFKVLNAVLKCPVRNCESLADWMSNPILGSSLDSFEILAKLSFIGRMSKPVSKEWLDRVARLRSMCEYYTPAAPSKPMGDNHWQNFKINSMAGVVTAKACWLFASKLLYFDLFDIQDQSVQECVDDILMCCKKIPVGHNVWGILPWVLLVTGAFVVDQDQQAIVLDYVELWSERAHSYNSFKIAAFLRKAWASGNAPDFLFERSQLLSVSM